MMKKDFNYHNDEMRVFLAQDQANNTRWTKLKRLLIAVLILLIAASALWVWSQQHSLRMIAHRYTARVEAWFAQHKMRTVNKTAPVILAKNAYEPIHFEFYDTLPAMQVRLETSELPTASAKRGPILSKPVSKSIGDAEALTRHVAEQLWHKQYIIQLGLFRQAFAAERYRQSLLKSGMQVTVSKVKEHGTAYYRLQQGPYSELTQAKTIQQQLQKKGIDSIIRKIESG